MLPDKFVLIATDETILGICADMNALVSEARALVKVGDYGHGELAIYTMTHTHIFELTKEPHAPGALRRVPGRPGRVGRVLDVRELVVFHRLVKKLAEKKGIE